MKKIFQLLVLLAAVLASHSAISAQQTRRIHRVADSVRVKALPFPLQQLVELYARTGNKKYLNLSQRFYHKAVMKPLAEGRGKIIEGLHANMQIPKVIGAARFYELVGRPSEKKVAEVFRDEVVHHHTYVNGGK